MSEACCAAWEHSAAAEQGRDAAETAEVYCPDSTAEARSSDTRERPMSATSMARLASGDTESAEGTFKGSLQSIADYIPSEGLGVYLAAQGLLIPAKEATDDQVFRLRLVCFAIGLAVVAFLAFAAFDGTKFEKAEARRRRWVVTIVGAVAFLIYGAATPLFFLSGQTYLTIAWSQWAAIVTIISALALPYVANVLNIKPPKPSPPGAPPA